MTSDDATPRDGGWSGLSCWVCWMTCRREGRIVGVLPETSRSLDQAATVINATGKAHTGRSDTSSRRTFTATAAPFHMPR